MINSLLHNNFINLIRHVERLIRLNFNKNFILVSRKVYFSRQRGLQRGNPFAALRRVLKDAEHPSKGTIRFPSEKKW